MKVKIHSYLQWTNTHYGLMAFNWFLFYIIQHFVMGEDGKIYLYIVLDVVNFGKGSCCWGDLLLPLLNLTNWCQPTQLYWNKTRKQKIEWTKGFKIVW